MKHVLESWIAFAAATLVLSVPLAVRACPMCFSSGENDGAFLYGSIFLMVVPVLSLGGLGYWAYRRVKAIEGGVMRPDADAPMLKHENEQAGAVLQIAPRR